MLHGTAATARKPQYHRQHYKSNAAPQGQNLISFARNNSHKSRLSDDDLDDDDDEASTLPSFLSSFIPPAPTTSIPSRAPPVTYTAKDIAYIALVKSLEVARWTTVHVIYVIMAALDWLRDEDSDYEGDHMHSRKRGRSGRPISLHRITPKDFLDVRLALVVLWMVVLWWGETGAFDRAVRSCVWDSWEEWPSPATPHHLVLVADPQLVDPHTYPGRPWPLSSLTIYYTDRYITTSFARIQHFLNPDSVFFLGDLFDGGREWSPPSVDRDSSIDKRWRKYGQKYWLKEYRRFSHIFYSSWLGTGKAQRDQGALKSRRIMASLPGNHDLGLGMGIREPVRQRFNAYFGEGNRVDILGNHSIVSVDTVSLSAKGQLDEQTGNPKMDQAGSYIWEPTEEFLHRVAATKARAVRRYLNAQNSRPAYEPMAHTVLDSEDARAHTTPLHDAPDVEIPSILLTHVPLYRAAGTPCGPLRERWPPSKSPAGSEPDERNSLKLQAGEQYQNVLTPTITRELVELVGDVTNVFSGDDHDYCDMVHHEFTSRPGSSGIREVTVKSISWAMGMRRPGFLLASLWNPVDETGRPLPGTPKATVQTHLCLLPDQLQIFIRYGYMLALTTLILGVHAWHATVRGSTSNNAVLPQHRKPDEQNVPLMSSTADIPLQTQPHANGLASRSTNLTSRTPSPSKSHGYGYVPPTSDDVSKPWDDVDLSPSSRRNKARRRGLGAKVWRRLQRSLVLVGVPGGLWYMWLIWSG